MKFESKYDIGERLWLARYGYVSQFVVTSVRFHGGSVSYYGYIDHEIAHEYTFFSETFLHREKNDALVQSVDLERVRGKL